MMDLVQTYNYLLTELSSPESRDWLFISSPYPVLLITVGYLYFVLYAGPCYMKNRPPYKLRTFILIYNLFQILANLWLLKLHKDAGWFSHFTEFSVANCGNHYASYLDAPKVFSTLWWVYLLKLSDYIETCIFVLRKKQNQVSSLHTFHHVSNVTFAWFFLKYFLDVRASFFTLLNCFVHVIMYIYYFISAWSPNLQRTISPFKPLLTKLQMIQLLCMVLPLLQFSNCNVPKGFVAFFIINLIIFLYLFYDFYKKSYTSKQKNN
ncbi:PREDICTED: elongation of very long chain fatty acids protein AAEL008004-like isoform X2 [Vollenhovia emeryi]|uniref:elongation of very long chain fatty acids protein AAEL008004-like isoform X2 n=1 Tax=Vollenhovia emeryi TaxID=411798 RepID=UPI0005F57859|nr:PREDICTED: elongation of very long chain fatty acids protein AAEL008004-like isoform X2 [Vollenhovia emeryi]